MCLTYPALCTTHSSSCSLAHLRLAAGNAFLKLVKDRNELSLAFSDFLQVSLVSQVGTYIRTYMQVRAKTSASFLQSSSTELFPSSPTPHPHPTHTSPTPHHTSPTPHHTSPTPHPTLYPPFPSRKVGAASGTSLCLYLFSPPLPPFLIPFSLFPPPLPL